MEFPAPNSSPNNNNDSLTQTQERKENDDREDEVYIVPPLSLSPSSSSSSASRFFESSLNFTINSTGVLVGIGVGNFVYNAISSTGNGLAFVSGASIEALTRTVSFLFNVSGGSSRLDFSIKRGGEFLAQVTRSTMSTAGETGARVTAAIAGTASGIAVSSLMRLGIYSMGVIKQQFLRYRLHREPSHILSLSSSFPSSSSISSSSTQASNYTTKLHRQRPRKNEKKKEIDIPTTTPTTTPTTGNNCTSFHDEVDVDEYFDSHLTEYISKSRSTPSDDMKLDSSSSSWVLIPLHSPVYHHYYGKEEEVNGPSSTHI